MRAEQGSIVEGRITGITKYGAFVSIDGETSGMVHISEISSGFVKDVGEHLKLNQVIKAVVIAVNDNGKLALSVKQLPKSEDMDSEKAEKINKPVKSLKKFESPEDFAKTGGNFKNAANFEDMMNKFKHDSDEKISDLKKSLDPKKTRRRDNQKLNQN